jgi:hypothetical protein
MLAAGLDWGTVPDWLAGIGTLAAFFVALRVLAKELEARLEQAEDRRREQARLVSAWVSTPEDDLPPEFTLIVRNGSNEPVYQVKASMVPYDSPYGSDPEDGTGQPRSVVETSEILPPGKDWQTYFDPRSRIVPGPVSMSFTDAAGRRWTRYPDGRLVEPDRPQRRSRKDYMNAWIAGELVVRS